MGGKQPLYWPFQLCPQEQEVNLEVTCDLSSIIADPSIFHQCQGWCTAVAPAFLSSSASVAQPCLWG